MLYKKTLFLLLLVLIPTVTALGLTGDLLSPIIYEAGKNITNNYQVGGSGNEIKLSLSGDDKILEFISLGEVINDRFDLLISFPNKLIPSGFYKFKINVKEIPPPGAGITTSLAVQRVFDVVVYSHEKEIGVGLYAPSVNEGGTVNFGVSAKSMGYQDIDKVRGVINVFDSKNRSQATLVTEEKALPALKDISFSVPFNTAGLPVGDYWAEAIVDYDGKQKKTEPAYFKIGDLDIIINEYTKQFPQGFSKFEVNVTNNWANEIRNVYLKLLINEDEFLHTPTIDIPAWKESKLSGLIKVELDPGEYQGKLQLFYEGEMKEKVVNLVVLENEEEKEEVALSLGTIIMSVAFAVSLLILLFVVVILRKKFLRSEKNEF